MPEKTVQKEPGKKPVPSKKPKPQQEVVVQIPLSELHPFPDHPFQVREDASMQETAESVKEYGVLVPALARPREDGGYELIAGHRRKHACELAELATITPCGSAILRADGKSPCSGARFFLSRCRWWYSLCCTFCVPLFGCIMFPLCSL